MGPGKGVYGSIWRDHTREVSLNNLYEAMIGSAILLGNSMLQEDPQGGAVLVPLQFPMYHV